MSKPGGALRFCVLKTYNYFISHELLSRVWFYKLDLDINSPINFTSLLAKSAGNKLIFYYFFPENWLRHFMHIVSSEDNLYEMPKPLFCEK